MNRRFALLITLGWTLTVAACSSSQSRSPDVRAPQPSDAVVASVNVIAFPRALNIDEDPQADAIKFTAYFSAKNATRAMSLTTGSVEVQIYEVGNDGKVPPDAKPVHTWDFSAIDLYPYRHESMFGWGYNLTLDWGDDMPASNKVSFVVIYHPENGRPLASAPVIIPIIGS